MSFTLYTGTHEAQWLGTAGVPLFVSRRRLFKRKRLPRAVEDWACDGGGFTELSLFGGWQTTPAQWVAEARRFRDDIGRMQWAAIQDWMCEPWMVAKTGLSIEEHQRRTTDSLAELLDMAPDVPWAPVIQGWQPGDYFRHVDHYLARGFDLRKFATVGIGSVCRRQDTTPVEGLVRALHAEGIRLHGFGFKASGLARVSDALVSSDSMAWSYRARHGEPLPGCKHRKCSSCSRFMLQWREKLLRALAQPQQRPLFPPTREAA